MDGEGRSFQVFRAEARVTEKARQRRRGRKESDRVIVDEDVVIAPESMRRARVHAVFPGGIDYIYVEKVVVSPNG